EPVFWSELVTLFFQAEDGIRDFHVTGVQTCALPILMEFSKRSSERRGRSRMSFHSPSVSPQPETVLFSSSTPEKTVCTAGGRSRSEERRVGREWAAA